MLSAALNEFPAVAEALEASERRSAGEYDMTASVTTDLSME
ncbi:MAG: hypothetical protein WAN20_04605 [Pseudonocardiaceae bacterium]